MKMLFAVLTFALLSTAQADIPVGVYTGKDAAGATCQVEVVKIYFANNEHHPLNERAEVAVLGETWELAHPTVISEENSKVRFNHDQLLQVTATKTGAKILILKIDHATEPHGPKEAVLINDNYRNPALTTKFVCTGLSL